MSDQDAFEHIVAALHEATLDETRWPTTSALIDEACGLQGNALVVVEGLPDDVRLVSAGLYYRGERRADLEREYIERYHHIDESIPRFRQLPDGALAHTPALYTAEELKTSRAYNEAMHRLRGQNGLKVRLDGPDVSHIAWAIADPVGLDGWEASQLALLKGLLPHLRQFVRVQQTLVNAEALGASVTDLLETSRIGVIHLDRRGRIVAANDRARRILRHGDGLVDRQGQLSARQPADHSRLERLLAAALPATGAVSGSMLLHHSIVAPPFVVHVKPVSTRRMDFGARRVAALVLLVEPGTAPRLDPEVVATALGLTPVEGDIAVRLAEGRTVREIAAALGRNPSAVYWHLKQSYQKLGIARQADLVRVVLSVGAFV